MAQVSSQLPIDGDGICMLCKASPPDGEVLTCNTCVTPWHVTCLAQSVRPETLASVAQWNCPDCNTLPEARAVSAAAAAAAAGGSSELVAAIRAIEADLSLTERQKAKRRQELLSGKAESSDDETKGKGKENVEEQDDVLLLLDESLKCSFCMQLPERPVTTPCGHNFCLKCFQKWIGQGKRTCAKCRRNIPPTMASQPRINSSVALAIRMAKMSKSISNGGPDRVYHYIHNRDRPDKAFTTERAQKAGMANAASGRIFVTVPSDHFGPILAENDPERMQGVLVGECWDCRMECRQWGIHYPPVAGIAGQSHYGAQSVVLSGGYQDDEDHGEWFLYTGSGGRDLSGNKRTNKDQSFDQKFEKLNEALRVSCKNGYPVRVVRSEKEKRSSYAPEKGLRYDGVYRIEKCWRKVGKQGFKVCRYLFVRCDNEPAPWTSDEHGDRPRPLPGISELKLAIDVFQRTESPSWDYDDEAGCWKWKKPPPPSQKPVTAGNAEDRLKVRKEMRKVQNASVKERLLKGFRCLLCAKVLTLPVTTPCAHNFCKNCLQGAFAGQAFVKERTCQGGRKLRSQKNVMNCPECKLDISEFLQNIQVNRELMGIIEKLQSEAQEEENTLLKSAEAESSDGLAEKLEEGKRKIADEESRADLKRKRLDAESVPSEFASGAIDGMICMEICETGNEINAVDEATKVDDDGTQGMICMENPEKENEIHAVDSSTKIDDDETGNMNLEVKSEAGDNLQAPVAKRCGRPKDSGKKAKEANDDENGNINLEVTSNNGDNLPAPVVKLRGRPPKGKGKKSEEATGHQTESP